MTYANFSKINKKYIYTKYIYSTCEIFAEKGILSYGDTVRMLRLSYGPISILYQCEVMTLGTE